MNRYTSFFVLIFLSFVCIRLTAQNLPIGIRVPNLLKRKIIESTSNSRLFKEQSTFQSLNDSVQIAWLQRYDDTSHFDDEAKAMVKDNDNNIYVTGNTSGNGWDITTIKYNSHGQQQWLYHYEYGGDDIPYGIATDNHGSAYVVGYASVSNNNSDFLTMKIDSIGNLAWYNVFSNGPGPKNDIAFSVAVDDSGNVYSTGSAFFMTDYHVLTIKYNTTGTVQWVQRYVSPYNFQDGGEDLVLDSNHNIYITGFSQEAPGNYDVVTLKYNTNGALQWVQRYNGPADQNDVGARVALDPNLNVIVAGTQTGIGTLYDMLTIKYDNNGNQQWVSTYDDSVHGNDGASSLAVDEIGNIYITGFAITDMSNQASAFATIKYNPAGVQQWASLYYGPVSGYNQARDIVLDNSGGVYVTGNSSSIPPPLSNFDYETIKYDTSGQEQWAVRYNSPYQGQSLDYPEAITVDNLGGVYVAGESAGQFADDEDFVTIKYSQFATPVELTSFTANANGNNVILNWSTATETNNKGFEIERAITNSKLRIKKWEGIGFVDGHGTSTQPHQYSYTDNNVENGNYTYRLKQIDFDGIYKYSKEVNINVNIPLQFSLSQNYPNPFNPTTSIDYSIPKDENVSIILYNTLGQQVVNLVDENKKEGEYHIIFNASILASGVYYYRLTAGNNIMVKKMLLLK